VAANILGRVNWLNSEKQVKQWPAQGQWHFDDQWQQQGWRVARDGADQWEGCLSLFKFEVYSWLCNEHYLSIIARLTYVKAGKRNQRLITCSKNLQIYWTQFVHINYRNGQSTWSHGSATYLTLLIQTSSSSSSSCSNIIRWCARWRLPSQTD